MKTGEKWWTLLHGKVLHLIWCIQNTS